MTRISRERLLALARAARECSVRPLATPQRPTPVAARSAQSDGSSSHEPPPSPSPPQQPACASGRGAGGGPPPSPNPSAAIARHAALLAPATAVLAVPGRSGLAGDSSSSGSSATGGGARATHRWRSSALACWTAHPAHGLWRSPNPAYATQPPEAPAPKQHHRLHPGRQAEPPPAAPLREEGSSGGAAAASSAPRPPDGASWTTLPNLLSLSRVVSAPLISYQIAHHQWPPALALLALAGATDWLDGALARRLGHTSKLGSYLDPVSDKVLICSVVGTMGWLHMLPAWLAVLVVARDAALVGALLWYRARMFGYAWPGVGRFFDVDADGEGGAGGVDGAGGLPVVRPHPVSKANTALVMVLVGASVGQEWLGVPGVEALAGLEWAVAATTAASGAIYLRQYLQGRLLPSAGAPPPPSPPPPPPPPPEAIR